MFVVGYIIFVLSWNHGDKNPSVEDSKVESPKQNNWTKFLQQGVLGLPIFPMEDGAIKFPSTVKRIWFDVGAHKEAMYTHLPMVKNEDIGLIAFEPM
jgi:hypothetical protein